MKTFVWYNSRPQATKGFNDDLIISAAIGCWVKDVAFSINQRDIEYKKAFLDSMISTNIKLNTSIPGMQGYKKIQDHEEQKKHQDFLWLLKG